MVKNNLISIRTIETISQLDLDQLGLKALGEKAVSIARKKLADGPKTGLFYHGLPNLSSAPGEAPAFQNGELYKSLGFRTLSKRVDGSRVVEIFSDAPYAGALELGYGPRNLEPRPFLRPSLDQALSEFINKDFDFKDIFRTRTRKRKHR